MEETPRWEYRSWINRAHAQALFEGDWLTSPVEHRQDLYLIGPDAAFMPKLRDGTIFEIKRLLKTRDGIELWEPWLSIPLLHMPAPPDQLEAAGMHMFRNVSQPEDFTSIAAGAEQWQAVPTEKLRRLFYLDGLRCEVTLVILAGSEYWTFAAETAEFAPLAQLLDELRFTNIPNVNYRNFLIDRYRLDA
jgi:hypothetical protein